MRTWLLALALLAIGVSGSAQTYDLSWFTVDGGGATFSTGGSYSLGGTIGQPDASNAITGGTFSLVGGFWAPTGFAFADLSITKTDGMTTAVPGGSVTYTITAANSGPNVALATVGDTFPAACTSVAWTCVGAGGGVCTAGGSGNIGDSVNLPVGASVTYTATCTLSPSATGTLSNTATVTASGGVIDPVPGNNSATDNDTLSAQADLSITKSDGLTTAAPGEAITYTIVAANAGPSDAPGATVTDVVPAALTGATWTCVGAGGGTCTAAGAGNINDTVDLPVGGSVTYQLSAIINPSATGTLSNTATVAPPGGVTDPVPGNNSATDSTLLIACGTEIVAVPDGRLTEGTIGPGASAWIGASVRIGSTYSVEFKNTTGSVPPGTLTIFSGDDGCGGTSTVDETDTTAVDPSGSQGAVRQSFTAAGTQTLFRARLVNTNLAPITYTFSWSETTMFSAAWSDVGTFDTFYSFQNTTASTLNGTLTLLDAAGAVVTTHDLTIAAFQTASTNTAALGIARNQVGTARFTHDGPPGAIAPEAAIANFSISPAYVQPVRFQTMREAR
jgi:uncharacterized repeat protein (TIGR01451 family)